MKFNLVFILLLVLSTFSPGAWPDTTVVKIIAFNDFHGNLHSAWNVDGVPVGGVDVLAAYVDALKAQNSANVVVSAGDLIGASPLVSALFNDEPTIEVMNRLRLDFNAVGNHEFDAGPAELLRMQQGGCHPLDPNSCQGEIVGTPMPFEGAHFSFLAANVIVEQTGETLFPPYGIKTFAGHDIAFIGLTLEATPAVTLTSAVAGLRFLDEADTVNALIPELRARGIEAIVVLLHEGGLRSSAPGNIDDCMVDVADTTQRMPIRDVVNRLDDAVDLVLAGHSSIPFNCWVPNSTGRLIPVSHAQSAGAVITDIDLVLDATGEVIEVSLRNIQVKQSESVTAHQEIAELVQAYSELADVQANQLIGAIQTPISRVSDPATGQSDVGNLIADAQLFATQSADTGGAQIALMNSGGVRAALEAASYPGPVTYAAAYRVQPFANYLVTQTYTAKQLKDVLEQQFAGCMGREGPQILQVSLGFHYTWQESALPCEKIIEMTLNGLPIVINGHLLQPDASFRVTINNFMVDGGDGFSALKEGTERVTSMLDIEAVMDYLAGYNLPNAAYDPSSASLGKPRVMRLP